MSPEDRFLDLDLRLDLIRHRKCNEIIEYTRRHENMKELPDFRECSDCGRIPLKDDLVQDPDEEFRLMLKCTCGRIVRGPFYRIHEDWNAGVRTRSSGSCTDVMCPNPQCTYSDPKKGMKGTYMGRTGMIYRCGTCGQVWCV